MILQPPGLEITKLQAPTEQVSYAREVIRAEAAALEKVAQRLGTSFTDVIELVTQCEGRLGITGTGKSADVGQKIAGTLCSTGARAYHFDATRAVHGDLGMIAPEDLILILSHSGESEEIVRLLPSLQQIGATVVGMTGNQNSTLAQRAQATLCYGPLDEVCPLGLAPSASTTAMIALGDALAFVLLRMRGFTREDFAKFHPAGSLGRKLMPIEAMMRQGKQLRLASVDETVRNVFALDEHEGRRTGAVMLVDRQGKLKGLFTDSDLARLIGHRKEASLDSPIGNVMTSHPIQIHQSANLAEAAELMRKHRISELPVVDASGKPVGLLDITDLMGLIAEEELSAAA